jgi:endonuclease/exonuclease/phosphatase family metal-dependent hydrolase
VQELRAWIERKTRTGSATLLLGDLNTGPALPDSSIRGRVPEHYASFAALGFSNPYLQGPHAKECSFCSANTVNGGSSPGGSLIDHVLLRGAVSALAVERVLDQRIELDLGRERIQSHLSDHYGVAATLRWGR